MASGPTPINAHLTRLARARGRNQKYIGDVVFPAVPFEFEQGEYLTFNDTMFMGEENQSGSDNGVRQVDGKYTSFDFGATSTSFVMEEYYAFWKGDPRRSNTGTTGMQIREKSLPATNKRYNLVRERAAKAVLFATGTWTNSAIAAADKFDVATSDPAKTVLTLWDTVETSAAAGDDTERFMVVNPLVYKFLRIHPKFTKFLAGEGEITGMAGHRLIAEIFDVPAANLLVPRGTYNTAKKGQSFSGDYIWSDKYIWMGYISRSPNEDTNTCCAFVHSGPNAASVRTGNVDTGDQVYDWMRASAIGKYLAVETAGARLLTGVIS